VVFGLQKDRFLIENGLFSGQAVNNALEQAHFKNVAKPMFSGRKRTGFPPKSEGKGIRRLSPCLEIQGRG
jgi:hypothetical protein